jgi:hypothetical protein
MFRSVPMRLALTALMLSGVGFVLFGLILLIAPQATMASLGITVPDGAATVEIQAFYGGLELALGALLLWAAARPDAREHGLVLGAVSYGTVGLTRGVAMGIAGVATPFLWTALAVEAVLAGLCVLGWRRITA